MHNNFAIGILKSKGEYHFYNWSHKEWKKNNQIENYFFNEVLHLFKIMMFNNNMNDFHESPLGQINTDPRAFMANCCTSSWSWFSSLFPSLDGVYALYVFLLHATLCWRLIFDTVWIYKIVYRTLARIIVIPNTLLIKLYEIPYGKYYFQIRTK